MWKRRRHWFLRRLTLALAVAAIVAPAGQARHAESADGQAATAARTEKSVFIPGVTDVPKPEHYVKAGQYGMPTAMPQDYLRARGDAIEVVRAQPRNDALDRIEFIRGTSVTDSPTLVSAPSFDWGDAGLGAGFALALVLLGALGLVAVKSTRPQTA